MKLTSTAFKEGALIPRQYTCDGEDLSPPLQWEAAPQNTQSFALISDDPDAPMGTWVHWVYYNLPVNLNTLKQAVETVEHPSPGGIQGRNDFHRIGYGGPCPPSGTHRYYFKLYALDMLLDLPPGATKQVLLQAMEGHILQESQLMGRYKR